MKFRLGCIAGFTSVQSVDFVTLSTSGKLQSGHLLRQDQGNKRIGPDLRWLQPAHVYIEQGMKPGRRSGG